MHGLHALLVERVVTFMRKSRQGFSLVEMLVVISVIVVILGVSIPLITRARLNGVETMVVRELQTVGTAQTQYQSQFGKYAATLAELGPPNRGGVEGPQAAHLIPAALASGEKNGYLFVMGSTPGGYTLNASPKTFGTTGRRTFYLDQDGIVHQNWGQESATADSPEFK